MAQIHVRQDILATLEGKTVIVTGIELSFQLTALWLIFVIQVEQTA
jgi:hypothetical protein